MEINTSIVPVNVNRPLNEGANGRSAQTESDAGRAPRVDRETVNPDELQRRVEQKEASQAVDVSRFQSPESLPLRTQEALSTYQQTEIASQEFEGGELVGIDLFA